MSLAFKISLAVATFSCTTLMPDQADAMHISEGILPFPWAALWFAVSLPFLFFAVRQVRKRAATDLSYKPLLGLLTATVFIVSAMPIPIPTAGTCSHPCGTAISAILLGPLASILVGAGALLVQALLMAHGGISTWGANIVSMAIVGSVVGFAVFKTFRRMGAGLAVAAFAAGLLADWATYATTALELAAGVGAPGEIGPLFLQIAAAFVPTQLPIGIIEGFMASGMVTLLAKRRPDMLVRFHILKPEEVSSCL